MVSFEKELTEISNLIEDSKNNNLDECVFTTHDIINGAYNDSAYTLLKILKEKFSDYDIWYVDPLLCRSPHQCIEEYGIHIKW